jgi:hypothetical protein
MISECTHRESWDITLTREDRVVPDDGKWPEKLLINGTQTSYIRPGKIMVTFTAGQTRLISVSIIGRRVVPPSASQRLGTSRYRNDHDVPDWAQELIDAARQRFNCGRSKVGD